MKENVPSSLNTSLQIDQGTSVSRDLPVPERNKPLPLEMYRYFFALGMGLDINLTPALNQQVQALYPSELSDVRMYARSDPGAGYLYQQLVLPFQPWLKPKVRLAFRASVAALLGKISQILPDTAVGSEDRARIFLEQTFWPRVGDEMQRLTSEALKRPSYFGFRQKGAFKKAQANLPRDLERLQTREYITRDYIRGTIVHIYTVQNVLVQILSGAIGEKELASQYYALGRDRCKKEGLARYWA